jgi:hypothetical protein
VAMEEEIAVPGHYNVLKVMEEGSSILFHRFVSGMLMRVVVGSWRDLMKLRSPEGWQRRRCL